MVYAFFILLLFLVVYLYDYRKIKAHKNAVLNIILCAFTLLAGLRFRIGTDTVEYMIFYDAVPSLFDLRLTDFVTTRYAPLAYLLFSVAKTISSSFVVCQLLVSFIVNYSVIRFIKKYGKDGFVFTFLFMYFLTSYYMLNCEVLRESLAISVFLYSIDSLLTKRYVKYLGFCFVAVLFHSGALLLFVLPLVLKIQINKYSISLLFILYFCAFFIKDYLFLLDYFRITDGFSELIDVYSNSALNRDYEFMNIVGVLINILLPLLSYVYVVKSNKFDSFGLDHLFYMYLLTFILSRSVWIFTRYSGNYFGFFELYYYSYFIYVLMEKFRRIIPSFLLVFVLLLPRFVYLYSFWNNDFYSLMYPGFKKVDVVYPYTNYITNKNMLQERESFYRVINQYK